MTSRVLALAGVTEGLTGLALLLVPSLVAGLLLGEGFVGAGISSARVAGIALIALGAACWPGPPLLGMLVYSAGATVYLTYVAFAGATTGILLWPAVILHLVMSALLARAFVNNSPIELRDGKLPDACKDGL